MDDAYGTSTETYTFRHFTSDDHDSYLDLYETVFGDRPSSAWFDWKYTHDPYVDHVPIVVAECDGILVGARSFFALPLRAGDVDLVAFQPCDTMVHPDHRRRGLFTRMTERALTEYANADPALLFNFPNERTLAGNLKLGWELVENLPVRYRFQDPTRSMDSVPKPVGRGLATVCRLYNRIQETRAPTDPAIEVTRHSQVPATDLATLAQQTSPDGFHVPRDRRFYEWRYDRPDRSYETFVAHRDSERVGAAVVSSVGRDVRLLEFVPQTDKPAAISGALLRAIVRRFDGAEFLTTLADDIDPSVLRLFGFHNGRRRPLDRLVGGRPFVVRPITVAEEGWNWSYGGLDLRVPDNWTLRFGDFDVY